VGAATVKVAGGVVAMAAGGASVMSGCGVGVESRVPQATSVTATTTATTT
jgi:hypothetical protein